MRVGEFDIDGYRFGCDHPVAVLDWDTGVREVRTQDVDRPGAHGVLFGRDYDSPPEWTFTVRAKNSDKAAAFDVISEFRQRWQASQGVGEMSVLKYGLPGRERKVYGRPRRWSLAGDAPRQGINIGRLVGLCTFQLSDPRSFGAGPGNTGETVLTLVPESTGGLIAPLVTPLTTTRRGGERAGVIRNPGDAPTPITVTFHGPVSNPKLYGEGWEIGLTGNLAYDEKITVNALGKSVTRSDGANMGGRLTRGTRLNKAALAPGEQEIWFTGADETGTAKAVVSWSAAYWSL